MSNSFTCLFCNHTFPLIPSTYYETENAFHTPVRTGYLPDNTYSFNVRMYKCPNCKTITSVADYTGTKMPQKSVSIFPVSVAKQFPPYIPEAVRQDYEEACSIVKLSPKSSATLSRRCLQGMIRDFQGITGKKRLVDEIDALQDKVPAAQWKILNSIRRLGNIGAHPEANINLIIDIEPEDAQKLISVIELLIRQWYIERHEQEQLYTDILELDQDTQAQKDKGQKTTLFLLRTDHFPPANSHQNPNIE